MSIAVELPALGESVVEGEVARWLVAVGDTVVEDQPLVEVTTDKVDAEIPSPTAGVVVEILVEVGAIVPVGTALARIDSDASAAAAAPQTAAVSTVADVPGSATVAAPAADGPKATPLARRIAEQADVDLASVHGSGAAGRVTKEDVERHLAAAAEPVAPAAAPAPPASVPVASPSAAPARRAGRPAFMNYTLQPEDKVIPMSPLRRLVAEHMVLSKHTSPHVGTVAEIDFGGIFRLREQHKRAFKEAHGFSLSYLPFIVHATVRALREFPALNASVVEDAIVEKQAIHIGVAVETEKGLVVPVLRHADRLSLSGLAQAIDDIADRARSKRLSPDELQGGTFTISNPGREGNLYGFAIINQPQVGILRMGEIVKRPVVITQRGEDAIAIRPMMYLALSYDHRAVDGAPANGFLHRIRSLLEEAEFDI
ncbi:MAG: 2-oxo acid dehydrogenase subunit E2 [Deltaproteobacteria bacterium]|nr:2-oxo acid dehydrogenase subunit E2 [Deltaproteobacteria bacterium]MBW2400363.1 2-oxo acid dehydrogenase subunit E2 [Deltaproteobacteria bacterium]